MEGGDESEEGDIRKKDTIIEGHLRICRKKNDCSTENYNYNQVQEKYIQELLFSDFAEEEFLRIKSVFPCSTSIFNPFWALSNSLKPSF